ncbi:LOW QUALITY PROTEIN: hypothetical protein T265_13852 [Opisthorchis viverrini]|uniref:Uncharacterized protein n=1 Tax=Opisthorchis viverrini TaxID=6198 RepID=A0A075AEX1_OPIVI|nr:LOW QUALITY PROTEIN: hypothetical protein T265_13852 [Opisthorchis viverrini]KER27144.1 LOW QUALITY PROTEIN: hypothetical protein T265_13852 [Opisthorchis viverrini]
MAICLNELNPQKLVQKAFAILRIIRRTFSRITLMDFQILYGAYVRPLLEYANQVVYSGRTKDVTLIERSRQAATRMVVGLKSVDYETRLAMLDLFPRTAACLISFPWSTAASGGTLFLLTPCLNKAWQTCFLPLTQQTPGGDIVRKFSSSEHTFIRQIFFSFRLLRAMTFLQQLFTLLPEPSLKHY